MPERDPNQPLEPVVRPAPDPYPGGDRPMLPADPQRPEVRDPEPGEPGQPEPNRARA